MKQRVNNASLIDIRNAATPLNRQVLKTEKGSDESELVECPVEEDGTVLLSVRVHDFTFFFHLFPFPSPSFRESVSVQRMFAHLLSHESVLELPPSPLGGSSVGGREEEEKENETNVDIALLLI